MPSLLLVVFVLQVVIHLVNTVGAPVINEFLWTLWNKLPYSSTSSDVRLQTKRRRELVGLKQELNATSAQDQFAKWARLDRQYSRMQAEYDAKANDLKDNRASFDRIANFLRWGGTNGLRFFLQFWFAKRPMFWIPRGWAPWYVEWILAFARAPRGSVSIQMWFVACATVVQLVGQAVAAGVVLVGERQQGMGKKREKMAMGAGQGGRDRGKSEEKKEL